MTADYKKGCDIQLKESLGGLAQSSVAHGEALGKVGQGWLGLKGKPVSEGQVWAGSICETWRAGLNTAVG